MVGASALAAGPEVERVSINLPAQPLSESLIQIGAQTGVAIAFTDAPLANLQAPRVSGTYSVREIFDLVLSESGFRYEFIDPHTVRIARAVATPPDAKKEAPKSGAPVQPLASRETLSMAPAEVVVTGFRASVLQALDVKRDAVGIQDSILAEDIADFPDLNLAEALQRIPGVTINRDASEGRQIALRGLGSDFVRTQLNGMETLFNSPSGLDPRGSVSRTRSFDYSVFASELFSRVDVYKSYSVHLDEGGIGGTVNLTTPKPFDYDGTRAVFSVKASENTRAEELNPRVAGILSGNWENFGALVSAAYSETDTVEFGTRLYSWVPVTYDANNILAQGFDAATYARLTNAGGAFPDDRDKFFHPEGMVLQTWANHRERLGVTSAFQYNPREDVKLTLDVLYGRISNDRQESALGTVGANELYRDINGTQRLKSAVIEGDNIVAASYDGVDLRSEGKISRDETKFQQTVLNGTWKPTASLSIDGMLGYARSELDSPVFDKIFLEKKNQSITFDFRHPELRRKGVAGIIDYELDLTDLAGWNLTRAATTEDHLRNEFRTAKLDATWNLGGEGSVQLGTMYKEFVNEGYKRNVDRRYDPLSPTTPQMSKYVWDMPSLAAYVVPDVNESYPLIPSHPRDLGPQFNRPGTDFSVSEDTLALYSQYNIATELGSIPFRANIGVRYVKTDVLSDGTANLGGGVLSPVSISSDYDYFLPAFSLAWDLTNQLVMRVGANRNISRPTLTDMRAAGDVTVLQTGGTIRSGNPELAPFVADSVDVSLEYYHGRGNYLAIGAFHKDMQSFIVNETKSIPYGETGFPLEFLASQPNNTAATLFDVGRPVNGDGASIAGAELAAHQSFDFLSGAFRNFGVIANVTYADGKTLYTIAEERFELPLFELSKWSANATLYYEASSWGARVSYAFRDTYLIGNGPESNIGEGRRPTHNIDFAAFYNVSRNLRVLLEATDLTEQPIDQYFDVFNNRTGALTRAGRNYLLGATYQF